mmetsp:Transcript_37418/g.60117  ORF Transcript_37418/g.60117 Transcript_37418/m.60117 type:complete len:126 (-) Transcript_37418:117-494(-)
MGTDDDATVAPSVAKPEPVIPEVVFSKAELLQHNGVDAGRPLLMGCKGLVFDVTAGADFYGPTGPYKNFSGRDASRALALMSLAPEHAENSSLEGLKEEDLQVLDDWFKKFKEKYPVVGIIDKYE